MSVMAERRFASANAGSYERPVEDEQFLDLLRRWVSETEEAIFVSRALIRSSRDAIELLERLQSRQSSGQDKSLSPAPTELGKRRALGFALSGRRQKSWPEKLLKPAQN
jgi:hypothetical protein